MRANNKPPTLGELKLGATIPGKPLTIEEQKLSSKYGSVSQGRYVQRVEKANKEYQAYVEKSTSQKSELQSLIDNVDLELKKSYEKAKELSWDISVRREEQANQKDLIARREVYEQALKNLENGGYYESFNDIKSGAVEYGTKLREYEMQMFSDRAAKDKAKEKFAKEAGYASYKDLLSNTVATVKNDTITFTPITPTTIPSTNYNGEITTITPEIVTPLVSPVKVEQTQDLKVFNTTKDYGLVSGRGITGASISQNVSMVSSQQPRTGIGTFLSGITGGFKKEVQEQKEKYSSVAGGFQTVSATGTSATSIIRPPTPTEQATIFKQNISEQSRTLSIAPPQTVIKKETTVSEYTKPKIASAIDTSKLALKYETPKDTARIIAGVTTASAVTPITSKIEEEKRRRFESQVSSYNAGTDYSKKDIERAFKGYSPTTAVLSPSTPVSDEQLKKFASLGDTAAQTALARRYADEITVYNKQLIAQGKSEDEIKTSVQSLIDEKQKIIDKVSKKGQISTIVLSTAMAVGSSLLVTPAFLRLPKTLQTIGGVAGGVSLGKEVTVISSELLSRKTTPLEAAQVLVPTAAFMVAGGIQAKKIQSRQFENYNKALEEFNKLKESGRFADSIVKEEPFVNVGTQLKGDINIAELRKLGFKDEVLSNVKKFEISQGSQVIEQKFPKINSVDVPKNTELYNRGVKKSYYVETEVKSVYKNVINYVIQNEEGKIFTRSIVFYTNKPISNFRSLDSALKYAKGKRLILGTGEEGNDLFASRVLKSTRKGTKLEADYLSKSSLSEEGIIQSETRRVGKVARIKGGVGSLQEAFELSPQQSIARMKRTSTPSLEVSQDGVSLGISRFKETGITKTKRIAADTSVAQRAVKEADLIFERNRGSTKKMKPWDLFPTETPQVPTTPSTPTTKGTTQVLAEPSISPKFDFNIRQAEFIKAPKPKVSVREIAPELRFRSNELVRQFGLSSSGERLLSNLRKESKSKSKLSKANITKEDVSVKNLNLIKNVDRVNVTQRDFLALRTGSKQTTENISITETVIPTILTPIGSQTPRPPTPPKPVEFISMRLKRKEAKYKKEQPYDVEVLRESLDTNRRRWEKVNREPLTKDSALSIGAKVVDNSSSAQFRVNKSEPVVVKARDKLGNMVMKKVQQVAKDLDDDYYKQNSQKFRPFKQKRGVRMYTPNRYIEKQKYRIDSLGEKAGITLTRKR